MNMIHLRLLCEWDKLLELCVKTQQNAENTRWQHQGTQTVFLELLPKYILSVQNLILQFRKIQQCLVKRLHCLMQTPSILRLCNTCEWL